MKKNKLKKKQFKKKKKRKKETTQPFTVDCYSEKVSNFSIFLILKNSVFMHLFFLFYIQ